MKTRISTKRKLIFSFVTCTLALGCLNGVAWLLLPKSSVFWDNPLMMMYPVDTFDPAVTGDQLFRNDDPRRRVRYVPDQHRWFRLDPEPTIPASGKLILHFGDSSTWGWGLADQQSAYPGVLARLLDQPVHSVNLGVPGYTSLQGRRYLETLLPKVHDRVVAVTIYFGNNDATSNLAPDATRLNRSTNSFFRWVRGLALGRAIAEICNRLPQDEAEQPRVSADEYAENLRQMVDLVRSYGIAVVLIMPPVNRMWPPVHLYPRPIKGWRPLADRVSNRWTLRKLDYAKSAYERGKELLEQQSDKCASAFAAAIEHDWVLPRIKAAWQQRLREITAELAVPLVELPEVFIGAEFPYTFEDYCHPSARVHEQIAQEIATTLVR